MWEGRSPSGQSHGPAGGWELTSIFMTKATLPPGYKLQNHQSNLIKNNMLNQVWGLGPRQQVGPLLNINTSLLHSFVLRINSNGVAGVIQLGCYQRSQASVTSS